jgi:hypothetical protein
MESTNMETVIKNYGANSISKNMRVIQYRNGVSVIILNKIKS